MPRKRSAVSSTGLLVALVSTLLGNEPMLAIDLGPAIHTEHTRSRSKPDFHDEGFGYDVFGLHLPTVQRSLRAALPWYRRYFRVASHGIENVPARGGAILVANHGGMLPIDAAMLWIDVIHRTGRCLRTISDRFIPLLPFASAALARTGVVSGTHANVRRLLERDELICIFPEGVTGPAKSYRDRYCLQRWRVGHAEHAIRYRVPIVPVAIVGAEESWPVLVRGPLRMFGAPYFPIPMTPLPLPVSIEIHYGTPIELHHRYSAATADEPDRVSAAANETRVAVKALLERARAERSRS